MQVELKVGKRLPVSILTYFVEASYMHGDADANSTEGEYFPVEREGSIEDLKKTIIFLTILKQTFTYGNVSAMKDNFAEKLAAAGYTEKDIDNFTDNYMPGDSTCNFQYPAKLTGFEVTYFDANGTAFEVEVTITE